MSLNGMVVRSLFTFLIRCSVVAVAAIAPVLAVEPITEKPWREAVLSVTDLDVTGRFFTEIGGYSIGVGDCRMGATRRSEWKLSITPRADGG